MKPNPNAVLTGSSLPRNTRRGRPQTIFKIAPVRPFERVEGQYPVKTPKPQSVEKQIEVTRTKERSFTKRGERIGGRTTEAVISNGDAERGVRQRKEITDMQDFLQIAFDPFLAPNTNTTDFTAEQIDTSLAYAGDAMGDAFTVGETVRHRKMPLWMSNKSQWRQFCESLAVHKSTYRQNVALLKLTFERNGHTDEEIFDTFWDSNDAVGKLDNGEVVFPNWPFETIEQMLRRRAELIKRGNKMFGAEPIERGRQRKPYKSLLCGQHSQSGEEAVPIRVVEYLGNNEYVLKCGCHRTVTDYTAPDKSGKRKPIIVGKEAKNVEIVEPIEIFSPQQNQQLNDDMPEKVA